MINLLYILLALVLLGVIVTVHEFGHYLVGRACGIGVIEFSVGMGPKLFGWERKGIKYSLRLLPLGGYCSFVGEDENSDNPHAMNNQPVWKRMLTVLAGPAVNLLLAVIVATGLIAGGVIVNPFEVDSQPVLLSVVENSAAAEAGLLPGDAIAAIDGEAISCDSAGMERAREIIGATPAGSTLTLTVKRGGETLDVTLSPRYSEEDGRTMIGVSFQSFYRSYDLNVFEAIPEAFKLTWRVVVETVKFLKNLLVGLFTGQGVQDGAVQGVVGIVSTVSDDMKVGFGTTFVDGLYSILYWLMIISMNLGIMNLLPLPALDGGRMLFLVIEGLRGKPFNREREGLVNLIGFALLIMLAIFITYKDIVALVH